MELPDDSPAKSNLTRIEAAAQRAYELTQQLQLYAGNSPGQYQLLDMDTLLQEVARILKNSLPSHIAFEYTAAPELPKVKGDAGQLRRMVLNLATNAREAIGERRGKIVLEVGTCEGSASVLDPLLEGESSHGQVLLSIQVQDNGCGINQTDLDSIFDPFFSTKAPDRGLGLPVALGIVKSHRGKLEVNSDWGKGTVVKALLPAIVVGSSSSGSSDLNVAVKRRVLIADDEDQIRELMEKTLQRFGFEVIIARNGREAIELFHDQASRIDIVILDMSMPDMNGEQVFHQLQSLKSDVKVLLSSGTNTPDKLERLFACGLKGFLQKPYMPRELAEKVNQILNPTVN